MFISEIKLQNFRNYKEQSIKLNKKINVFLVIMHKEKQIY